MLFGNCFSSSKWEDRTTHTGTFVKGNRIPDLMCGGLLFTELGSSAPVLPGFNRLGN